MEVKSMKVYVHAYRINENQSLGVGFPISGSTSARNSSTSSARHSSNSSARHSSNSSSSNKIGIFHSSVIVDEHEFDYSADVGVQWTIREINPLIPEHRHYMGTYYGTFEDVKKEVNYLASEEFSSSKYNLIQNNCHHFTQKLCKQLAGVDIPNYLKAAHTAVETSVWSVAAASILVFFWKLFS